MRCKTGKSGFGSRRQADARAKRMRRDKHARLSAYRCDVCHEWHIGETPAAGRNRPGKPKGGN